jgi:hypothetical protein
MALAIHELKSVPPMAVASGVKSSWQGFFWALVSSSIHNTFVLKNQH